VSFGGVSRRELLAGLAGVGVVGGLTGLSTGAFLGDREAVAGSLTGGAVDLEVTWAYEDGPSGTGANGATVPATNAGTTEYVSITLDLPQRRDHVNNPAIVWVRLTCLEDLDVPTDDLRVELTYDSGVLDGLPVFGPASLTELLAPDSPARRGVPLAVDHDEYCFDTSDGGGPMRLRLRLSLAEEYRGELAFGLPLEFVAYQCRGESALDNPFAGRPVPPCDGSEPRPNPKPDPAISFLAFCVREDGPNSVPDPEAIDIVAETTKDDGEVTAVRWTRTDGEAIDAVVVGSSAATKLRNFRYDPPVTTGVVGTSGGAPAADGQRPSDPCPEGHVGIKFEASGDGLVVEDDDPSEPDATAPEPADGDGGDAA
jgi:hypothetical protein